jgi:hypothetical protein
MRKNFSACRGQLATQSRGSRLVVRLNVYLLVSVIWNESVNLLMVGGSEGLVNITITA